MSEHPGQDPVTKHPHLSPHLATPISRRSSHLHGWCSFRTICKTHYSKPFTFIRTCCCLFFFFFFFFSQWLKTCSCRRLSSPVWLGCPLLGQTFNIERMFYAPFLRENFEVNKHDRTYIGKLFEKGKEFRTQQQTTKMTNIFKSMRCHKHIFV